MRGELFPSQRCLQEVGQGFTAGGELPNLLEFAVLSVPALRGLNLQWHPTRSFLPGKLYMLSSPERVAYKIRHSSQNC